MKRHMRGSDDSFWEREKIEGKEEAVIYHFDTSTMAVETSTFNIIYSWEEPLEKISNDKIFPHITIPRLH